LIFYISQIVSFGVAGTKNRLPTRTKNVFLVVLVTVKNGFRSVFPLLKIGTVLIFKSMVRSRVPVLVAVLSNLDLWVLILANGPV
jgi:hypothetical protein